MKTLIYELYSQNKKLINCDSIDSLTRRLKEFLVQNIQIDGKIGNDFVHLQVKTYWEETKSNETSEGAENG